MEYSSITRESMKTTGEISGTSTEAERRASVFGISGKCGPNTALSILRTVKSAALPQTRDQSQQRLR